MDLTWMVGTWWGLFMIYRAGGLSSDLIWRTSIHFLCSDWVKSHVIKLRDSPSLLQLGHWRRNGCNDQWLKALDEGKTSRNTKLRHSLKSAQVPRTFENLPLFCHQAASTFSAASILIISQSSPCTTLMCSKNLQKGSSRVSKCSAHIPMIQFPNFEGSLLDILNTHVETNIWEKHSIYNRGQISGFIQIGPGVINSYIDEYWLGARSRRNVSFLAMESSVRRFVWDCLAC